MAATASATAKIPVLSDSPSIRSASGSTITAKAASSNGRYLAPIGVFIRISRYVRRAARAGAPATPQTSGCRSTLRRRRGEVNGDAAHHADQKGRKHDAPETPQAPDHHDDKSNGDDLGAHRGMHDRDRRKEGAAERRHADAEHDDRGHVRLQPDAKGRH